MLDLTSRTGVRYLLGDRQTTIIDCQQVTEQELVTGRVTERAQIWFPDARQCSVVRSGIYVPKLRVDYCMVLLDDGRFYYTQEDNLVRQGVTLDA